MSSGLNRWCGIGNMGADPELRYTPSNAAVVELRVAINEAWKDKNGTKQERTEWISVRAWRDLAEICAKYLTKGKQVYVEGRLKTETWEDKDGGGKRYKTIVEADKVIFLGGGQGAGRGRGEQPPPGAEPPASGGGNDSDDDIPF